jgi:hypothetical protein
LYLALLRLALLRLALLRLTLLRLALLHLALLKLSYSDYSCSLLILLVFNIEDDILINIEDIELHLYLGVYIRNYIPYSAVEVSNRYERTTSADLLVQFIDLVHQLVEALLPLIVDQAKRIAKDLI